VPGGLRLCNGACREPSDRAFSRKADADRNYARLAGMLFRAASAAVDSRDGLSVSCDGIWMKLPY
jgi:hypothetical protein